MSTKNDLAVISKRISAISKGCEARMFTVSRGYGMYSMPTRRWCRKQVKWLDGKGFCDNCFKKESPCQT